MAGASLTTLVACGDSESSDGKSDAPVEASQSVGSACSDDSDCGGYENAICADALRPVEDYVEDTGEPANTALRELTLPFPGGYCTSSLDSDCTSDAQCGEGAGCFRPFEGVSDQVIASLDATIPQLSVPEFADRGLCLDSCNADSECREDEGYTCVVPIKVFMDLINPDNTKKYCMKDEDYSYILMPPEE